MTIRELRETDVEEIRRIHSKHYKNEFEFPDFFNNFICAFAVTGPDNTIISAGGVRTIAEAVIITDKDVTARERTGALIQVLRASEFITTKSNHTELHAFIQDENWYRQLVRVGFLPTKGKPLVLGL